MRESSKHHAMVRWYSPALLARTGMRAAISTAVGQVADNREVRAALYPDPPLFDHSGDVGADGNFRLDFVADLGDGWDATFAVASAICADTQMTNDGEAPRGDVLIMGGDEIYPEPSVDGYCERTVAPWNAAGCENGDFSTTLYAIPGNHDWYDGLHAFGDVFCRQGRPFPGFEAARFSHLKPRQANSYFALKLPHGWWLCGIDIQLNNRIDPPQYDFFESVAKKISKGEQIILCAPTPSWVRETSGNPGASKLLATMMQVLSAGGGEIRLVLTGDLHHYSRYESADRRLTLITAGGGGAFLHPTHKLPAKAKIGKRGGPAREFSKVECYPLPEVSQKLAWRNLLFPFYNPDFALTLGAIYVLLSWFLVTRQIGGNAALTSLFTDIYSGTHKIGDTVVQFFDAIPKSPEFAIFVTAFTAAFIAFNLTRNVAARIGFGVLHTLAHIMALVVSYCLAVELVPLMVPAGQGAGVTYVAFFLIVFLAGALLGGFVFGAFLLAALNLLGWQWTNAFSSLRIANYKNFLRLKIAPDGTLNVYAFGIDDVMKKPVRARQTAKIVIKK